MAASLFFQEPHTHTRWSARGLRTFPLQEVLGPLPTCTSPNKNPQKTQKIIPNFTQNRGQFEAMFHCITFVWLWDIATSYHVYFSDGHWPHQPWSRMIARMAIGPVARITPTTLGWQLGVRDRSLQSCSAWLNFARATMSKHGLPCSPMTRPDRTLPSPKSVVQASFLTVSHD